MEDVEIIMLKNRAKDLLNRKIMIRDAQNAQAPLQEYEFVEIAAKTSVEDRPQRYAIEGILRNTLGEEIRRPLLQIVVYLEGTVR